MDAVALWAVPFGNLGGPLYHVVTDPELHFAHGRNPWEAFAIWRGGLGIWGAVAFGAVAPGSGRAERGFGCTRGGIFGPSFLPWLDDPPDAAPILRSKPMCSLATCRVLPTCGAGTSSSRRPGRAAAVRRVRRTEQSHHAPTVTCDCTVGEVIKRW